jgi:hypothetical protein
MAVVIPAQVAAPTVRNLLASTPRPGEAKVAGSGAATFRALHVDGRCGALALLACWFQARARLPCGSCAGSAPRRSLNGAAGQSTRGARPAKQCGGRRCRSGLDVLRAALLPSGLAAMAPNGPGRRGVQPWQPDAANGAGRSQDTTGFRRYGMAPQATVDGAAIRRLVAVLGRKSSAHGVVADDYRPIGPYLQATVIAPGQQKRMAPDRGVRATHRHRTEAARGRTVSFTHAVDPRRFESLDAVPAHVCLGWRTLMTGWHGAGSES